MIFCFDTKTNFNFNFIYEFPKTHWNEKSIQQLEDVKHHFDIFSNEAHNKKMFYSNKSTLKLNSLLSEYF